MGEKKKKAFCASKCWFWFGIFCCAVLSQLRSYCGAERVLWSQSKVAAFHRYLNFHLCPVTWVISIIIFCLSVHVCMCDLYRMKNIVELWEFTGTDAFGE